MQLILYVDLYFETKNNPETVIKEMNQYLDKLEKNLYAKKNFDQKHPESIWIYQNDSEFEDFDETVIQIEKHIRETYNSTLNGYWLEECEFQEHYRSEIHNGKIDSQYLNFIQNYPNEIIIKTKIYADKLFNEYLKANNKTKNISEKNLT